MDLLIRVPNWLGDLIMSLESLNGLRSEYNSMAFWSHPRVAELLPVFLPGIPVIPLEVMPRCFETVLLMTNSFSSALKARRTGASAILGYSGEGRGFMMTGTIRQNRMRNHHHSADFAALTGMLGATPEPLDISHIQADGRPHIAMFPGARFGPAKMWPKFPELAKILSEKTRLPVIFYGADGERNLLTEMAKTLDNSEVEAGLPASVLCSRLRSATLATGNDSGGVHLSAALGVPTVTIFGSTSPEWTAPRGKRTATVYLNRHCSPCFKRRCPLGGQSPCLYDIKPDAVLDVCMELIEHQ